MAACHPHEKVSVLAGVEDTRAKRGLIVAESGFQGWVDLTRVQSDGVARSSGRLL